MRALALLAELWAACEIVLVAGRMGDDAMLYAVLAFFLLCCCALREVWDCCAATPVETSSAAAIKMAVRFVFMIASQLPLLG